MDFSEYNEVVGAWLKEVLRNLGVDAELTLKYCRDIEEYAKKNNDAKLLGLHTINSMGDLLCPK